MKKRLSFRHRLVCALPCSLIYFLIYYGCFNQFIRNACCSTTEGYDESFLKELENKGLKNDLIIPRAFAYDKSPEGYNFWYRRAMWYEQYLKQIIQLNKRVNILLT